jgi:hypothetical protein
MQANITSVHQRRGTLLKLQNSGWSVALFMVILTWSAGKAIGGAKGSSDGYAPITNPLRDTIEVFGLIRDDCRTAPECCIRKFCLQRCGEQSLFYVESDSLDFRDLVGQEVRLVGTFFQCGAVGCSDVLDVVAVTVAPCSTTTVEPTTWGRIKTVYP